MDIMKIGLTIFLVISALLCIFMCKRKISADTIFNIAITALLALVAGIMAAFYCMSIDTQEGLYSLCVSILSVTLLSATVLIGHTRIYLIHVKQEEDYND